MRGKVEKDGEENQRCVSSTHGSNCRSLQKGEAGRPARLYKLSCHFRCSEEAIFGNEKPTIVVLPYREMSVMDMRRKGHLHCDSQVCFSCGKAAGSDATVETMNSVVGMVGAGLWIFVFVDKLQA